MRWSVSPSCLRHCHSVVKCPEERFVSENPEQREVQLQQMSFTQPRLMGTLRLQTKEKLGSSRYAWLQQIRLAQKRKLWMIFHIYNTGILSTVPDKIEVGNTSNRQIDNVPKYCTVYDNKHYCSFPLLISKIHFWSVCINVHSLPKAVCLCSCCY